MTFEISIVHSVHNSRFSRSLLHKFNQHNNTQYFVLLFSLNLKKDFLSESFKICAWAHDDGSDKIISYHKKYLSTFMEGRSTLWNFTTGCWDHHRAFSLRSTLDMSYDNKMRSYYLLRWNISIWIIKSSPKKSRINRDRYY